LNGFFVVLECDRNSVQRFAHYLSDREGSALLSDFDGRGRRTIMITHFIAFCLGAVLGIAAMCMCLAAGEADHRSKRYDEKGDGKE